MSETAVPESGYAANLTAATPGLATEFEDAEASPGFLLWRVTNAWQSSIRLALKPLGLTHVQFVLLASLSWLRPVRGSATSAQLPVTQQRLAAHAHTDAMMTSQVLRTLEQRGWVERQAHPTDGRARALAITASGRALADCAVRAVEECDRAFFAGLGDDVAALTVLLGRLASVASPATGR